MILCAPTRASLNLDLDALCPESYRGNTPDEERLLVFASELQRQYSHLYPERRPLLLCPANEYGVKVSLWPNSVCLRVCVFACVETPVYLCVHESEVCVDVSQANAPRVVPALHLAGLLFLCG